MGSSLPTQQCFFVVFLFVASPCSTDVKDMARWWDLVRGAPSFGIWCCLHGPMCHTVPASGTPGLHHMWHLLQQASASSWIQWCIREWSLHAPQCSLSRVAAAHSTGSTPAALRDVLHLACGASLCVRFGPRTTPAVRQTLRFIYHKTLAGENSQQIWYQNDGLGLFWAIRQFQLMSILQIMIQMTLIFLKCRVIIYILLTVLFHWKLVNGFRCIHCK